MYFTLKNNKSILVLPLLIFVILIYLSADVKGQDSSSPGSDCSKSQSVIPEGMVIIPAGWFKMGSSSGQGDETPVHKVYVDSFYMAVKEVTIGEYFQCVRDGCAQMPLWWNREFFNEFYDNIPAHEWFSLPVTGISWKDAVDFCRWKGKGYRLPTEAEWEYAARAGTTTRYFWGSDIKEGGRYANTGSRLIPSGSLLPNQFGLFDMTGNVWEWCSDYYQKEYYEQSPQKNPKGPEKAENPARHVIRGGSFDEYSWNLRNANRNFGRENKGYRGLGFRVAYSNESKQ